MRTTFNNSLSRIDEILSKNKSFSLENRAITFSKARNYSNLSENLNVPVKYDANKTLIQYDENFIFENYGHNDYAFSNICIGTHPDFSDLDHTNYLMHHSVSMFVDIKGSTKLVDKYSIQDVRMIKDTILSLIILVVNQFGGHIQRLQGDGVFITFCRRNREPINSIINALNASTILTQFISVDLADIFKKNDINPLRIRVGIDYGSDENVLWSYYGLSGCDELTTTSLHTDMAAKLQVKASDNSILIGNNIVEALDLTKEVISNYYNKDGLREEVYNITPSLTYKFYCFDWKNYLVKHPNFKLLANGNLKNEKKNFWLKCSYSFDDKSHEYFPYSKGIPKGAQIEFKLYDNTILYTRKGFEEIKWTVYNTGQEAKTDNCVSQEVDKNSANSNSCTTTAKYLGLHKIQCKLIRPHSENLNIEFPVFVY